MKALEEFNRGNLSAAVDLAISHVRDNPSDYSARLILAELFCIRGDLDRADKQLETALVQQPRIALPASLLRQLIRAEKSRQEFWREGRPPLLLGDAGDELAHRLRASISLRAGDAVEACELLEQAGSLHPELSGMRDRAHSFSSFADLDELCDGYFEVLTSTGKYYWIPYETVEMVEFVPPERPRDLIWRQCQMNVANGPDGVVFIPAIYPATTAEDGESYLLGRATDWRESNGAPVQGIGQRVFAFDDDEVPVMDLKQIDFGTSDKGT